MIDVVGLIAGAVAVFALWWSRTRRPKLPFTVKDPASVDPANKVRAERLLGPVNRMNEAKAKLARRK